MASLNTDDYLYILPAEKIALHPLKQRDLAKLLVFKNKKVEHTIFQQLTEFLPANTFLFFNDTKVIPARLHFRKESGADIEVFLLNPVLPSTILAETMHATATCTWHCTIGNLKRWNNNLTLQKQLEDITLEATLIDREKAIVEFRWTPSASFAEVVNMAGETPLPPYLKRKAEATDRERYQTIYSVHEGAVAAPTAGLHFTEAVFKDLKSKKIEHDFLTLHVSAGTFQPIKTENANDHVMHNEQIIVTRKNIENLLHQNRFIIPVGTTSMRTLESIYWYGVSLLRNPDAEFQILQNDPYNEKTLPSKEVALKAILVKMDGLQTDMLIGETSIFIKPGYRFQICQALITNFHQPGSTLILLVAAFVGEQWKKIYQEALENNYRFLSYGDSSLLFPV
jgi:S-adenosylmethionine:tRNA ribosyltransferase-isomerase